MRLFVNVDHVATVREARKTDEPMPAAAALEAMAGGADGITAHLREDRRHVNDDDMRALAGENFPLNFELAVAPDVVELAAELKPHQATFVPERREEVTTEGGLDLALNNGHPDPRLVDGIDRLKSLGVRVSLFIDPDPVSVSRSADLAVDAIELHTGTYANTGGSATELARLHDAAVQAHDLGLAVHAGHGLTVGNVRPVAELPYMEELNIGHHLVSRSIISGMRRAVEDMRAAMSGSV